jgi:putative glutamine amidotransferase
MTLRVGLSYRSTSPKDENYERALSEAAARAGIMVEIIWLAGHDRLLDLAAADKIHALVLTGGEDVDPALYNAEVRGARKPDRARDRAERRLLESVSRVWEVPILAICRGQQLLNALTSQERDALVQDLQTSLRHVSDKRGDARHSVAVRPGSMLASVIGSTIMVNSSHHQAVSRLADPFIEVATAPDGTIEAYERSEAAHLPWLLAVQWHPERLDGPAGSGIIDAFLAAARASATSFLRPDG